MNTAREGAAERSRFGELLRRFRLAAGLSQAALAERASVSVDSVSALERGISRAPQRETLELLLSALDLAPEQRLEVERAVRRSSRPRFSSRRTAPRKTNFAPPLTKLFGRERERREIASMLERHSVITLTGAGGVGKTRLAVQLGTDSLERFVDGVWFVDLAVLRDQRLVSRAVAQVLAVIESLDRPLADSIVEAVRSKSILLIIDNCEHVVAEAAKLVDALAHAGPRIRIVATSRQPLGIPVEQVYRVASLETPAAIALFVDRAKRAFESFQLTGDDAATIERICRRLDGIPLAIELAAARLNVLSPQQLEERLSERFRVLTGGSALALPRHQTMHALIDWSYELLASDEKTLFARLAVFPATFLLDAASAICGDAVTDEWKVFEVIASLVDKSLVMSYLHGNTQRYRMLESVRAFALALLPGGEIEDLKGRHAAYFTTLAEQGQSNFRVAASAAEWASDLDANLENIRAALDWALDERADIALGVRLLTALREFWLLRGLQPEAARRAETALGSVELLPEPLQAGLWLTFAHTIGAISSPAAAYEAATRARDLYANRGDEANLARALRIAGGSSRLLGNLKQARSDLLAALALSRRCGEQRDVARMLSDLAVLLQADGELPEARKTLSEVLDLAQDSGDELLRWITAANLADVEFELGDAEGAAARALDNLESEFLRENPRVRSHQESNLSTYLLALQREDDARSVALEAIRHADEAGYHGIITTALHSLAAALARKHPRRAARLLGYVESVLEKTGYKREYTERFTQQLLMNALTESLTQKEISNQIDGGKSITEEQAVRLARLPVEKAAL